MHTLKVPRLKVLIYAYIVLMTSFLVTLKEVGTRHDNLKLTIHHVKGGRFFDKLGANVGIKNPKKFVQATFIDRLG